MRQRATARPLLYIRIMLKALSLILLALPVVACTVGPGGTPTVMSGDDGSDTTPITPPPTGSDSATHITTDTTWSDTKTIDSVTVIDTGVTVTVAPGTVLSFTAAGSLSVDGTLAVAGVKGNTVKLKPATGTNFSDILVAGTLTMAYAEMTGGAFQMAATSTNTITDSTFSNASHDLVVLNGGTLSFKYSQVGLSTATGDTTHCDLHFGGDAPTIVASHSNFNTSSYGVMFYAGQNADFTYTNWMNNTQHVDGIAGQVTGDFSNSYFMTVANTTEKAPVGAGYTLTNVSTTTMVPACTGTNDAICAGVR